MKGLLLRLSALDAAAENAVRVIGFFDELMARRVDVPTLVGAGSRLAECPVGVATEGDPIPENATSRQLPDGTVVWLSRSGAALPLDDILLERLAIAAAVLLDHRSVPPAGLGDAALVELALSAAAGEAERSRALHLLGIGPRTQLTVLALAGTPEAARQVTETVGGHLAELGRLHAVIAPHQVNGLDGPGPIGISPVVSAIEAPTAWRHARTAVRVARDRQPVVRWTDLGALAVLVERLRPEDIAEVADVAALDRIAEGPGGRETLDILTAFCATESARKAAEAVYRHHSTVAVRLAQAETQLGFPVTTPDGKRRLDLALLLRHLRQWNP